MSKYTHLFNTNDQFVSAYTGTGYTEPWVSYTLETSGASYNKVMRRGKTVWVSIPATGSTSPTVVDVTDDFVLPNPSTGPYDMKITFQFENGDPDKTYDYCPDSTSGRMVWWTDNNGSLYTGSSDMEIWVQNYSCCGYENPLNAWSQQHGYDEINHNWYLSKDWQTNEIIIEQNLWG